MFSVVDNLKAARNLIAQPNAFTKDYFAKDRRGREIDPLDPSAACYCTMGALIAVGCSHARQWKRSEEERFLIKALGNDNIPIWNDEDERSQADIVSLYDKAIALAEAESA